MNKDILDTVEQRETGKIFTILSTISALLIIALVVYIGVSIPTRIKATDSMPQISTIAMLTQATFFISIFGLIMGVISLVKRENTSWVKWVSALINIVAFVLFLGTIVIALTIGNK